MARVLRQVFKQWVLVASVRKATGRRHSNGSQKSEPTSGADADGNAMAADVLVGEQSDHAATWRAKPLDGAGTKSEPMRRA